MLMISNIILATFTAPEDIRTGPCCLLWLLPLVAAIAIAYKATKLPTIKVGSFLKETVLLFASIIVFLAITALALQALGWLVTE